MGWVKGSKAVLISDNWDIWQVPVDGSAAVNLTVNGRKDQIRYQRRLTLETAEEREDGIDLSKPKYFAATASGRRRAASPASTAARPGSPTSSGTMRRIRG